MALLSACFGFLFYGGWGYWVNAAHGHEMAVTVLMAQGSYSFVLTVVMTMIVEALYSLAQRIQRSFQWAKQFTTWSTVLVSCIIVFSGSWMVNYWAGTPNILATVSLGYVIGGVYIVLYVLGKARRAQAVSAD